MGHCCPTKKVLIQSRARSGALSKCKRSLLAAFRYQLVAALLGTSAAPLLGQVTVRPDTILLGSFSELEGAGEILLASSTGAHIY